MQETLSSGTAQGTYQQRDAWNQAVEFAQSDEELNELIRKISLAHPKLLKVLNPITGKIGEYRVASKSRGGGRGYSGDLVLLDELREQEKLRRTHMGSGPTKRNMRKKGAGVQAMPRTLGIAL